MTANVLTPTFHELEPSKASLSPGDMFASNSVSYALLLYHGLEWIHHLPTEARYIYKRTWKSRVKWQYLFSRYFGLVVQICNLAFINVAQARINSRRVCKVWLFFQFLAGQTLWASLEGSLLTRLFALYVNSESWELSFLYGAAIFEKAINLVWGGISIQFATVNQQCITIDAPPGVAFTQGTTALLLLLILFLTYKKQPKAKSSLFSLVFRDSSRAIGIVVAALIAIVVNNTFSISIHMSPPSWWNPTFIYQCSFPLIVAILTTANCRMIRNLEGFARLSPDDDETVSCLSTIELTSYIEMNDAPVGDRGCV